jgi:NADPH-dependent glutamate synthase beta subunit-like oxidoreductase/Pyruvate/2-oxoacid:ferredoxin oxidoreductase delta subunit
MGLLKKKKKSSGLGTKMSRSGGGSATQISTMRPRYVTKTPPCGDTCPSGNHIRDWLMVIALREKLGLSLDEACERAWRMEMETNPFPAVMGRVCPHPCESSCNRKEKDGAVGINSVERFIGDYGIEHKLTAEPFEGAEGNDKKVAVIGAGPSGLACAFQLARYGYGVTVFEGLPKAGGMLRYGIPVYRLPREVIDAEIDAIARLGVDIRCGVKVGQDVSFDELRKDYDAIYVAIGAHQGKGLGIEGEEGPGIWTGTEFLNHVNSGKSVDLGNHVVIIGGGDTAIDAARVSKRVITDSAEISAKMGADVTILYRRTRTEMPAIEREIEEALEENIGIEYLAAPKEILRDEEGAVRGLIVQRMALGEPDSSGRRRPVPIENDTYEVPLTTMIAAVSQKPDLGALGSEELGDGWLNGDDWGFTGVDGIWTGGDNINLGIATTSIGQGRKSADAIHAKMQGVEPKAPIEAEVITHDKLMIDWYEAKDREVRQVKTPEERLAAPFDEVDLGLTAEQALAEVERCFSCGKCFGCENCWMYCQNNVFKKAKPQEHGHFFDIKMELCDGCKKCWEECPCGFIIGE